MLFKYIQNHIERAETASSNINSVHIKNYGYIEFIYFLKALSVATIHMRMYFQSLNNVLSLDGNSIALLLSVEWNLVGI